MFLETRVRSQGWLLPAGLTHIPSTLRLFNMWTLGISHLFIPLWRKRCNGSWVKNQAWHAANLSVNRWVVGLLMLWHAQLHRTRYIQCSLKNVLQQLCLTQQVVCSENSGSAATKDLPGQKTNVGTTCWRVVQQEVHVCTANKIKKKKKMMTRYMSQLSGYTSNNWSVQQCQLPLIPPGKKKKKKKSLF